MHRSGTRETKEHMKSTDAEPTGFLSSRVSTAVSVIICAAAATR